MFIGILKSVYSKGLEFMFYSFVEKHLTTCRLTEGQEFFKGKFGVFNLKKKRKYFPNDFLKARLEIINFFLKIEDIKISF